MGTPAAFAWLIDSMVCGMTPSSAATTSTTMSVTCAAGPHLVNASWPGVSRKTTCFSASPIGDGHAEGAGRLRDAAGLAPATFALRILSSSDVLPWST
jgi:hypothetical protein